MNKCLRVLTLLIKWLPRRWCFVLSGKGLKGRGVSFKIAPKIVAYMDKEQENLKRLWIKLGSRKRILWPLVKAKTNHCKIQIPRFCQQKEEYCSSFPTKVAETLTWISFFPLADRYSAKATKQIKYKTLLNFNPIVKMPTSQTHQRSERNKCPVLLLKLITFLLS